MGVADGDGVVEGVARGDRFRRRLDRAIGEGPPILLDGATGTELSRRGVDTSTPLWSARALYEAPEILRAVHRDYVEAGAEVITANTFRTHRRSLAKGGLGERARELTERAVAVARRAIEEAYGTAPAPGRGDGAPDAPAGRRRRRAFVAGSVAPLEDCYSPDLVPGDRALDREHPELVEHLVGAGVDLLLVETMNTVREAVAAGAAAVASGLPTFVGLTCDPRGRLLSGESVAEAAPAVTAVGVDGLMINCTSAPHLHRALAELAEATDPPLGAYGNIGYADDERGWVITDAVDAEAYAGHARRWLELGAVLVGGCCGTRPEHLEALRATLSTGA